MADEIKYSIKVDGTSQAITSINAVAEAQRRLTTTSTNAGVALQNLNFVIRDSPYFFKDFSLGLLAVGNNLNPLIDSLLRMKKEAAETGTTLTSSLVAALKGPAGVVLAFSALVTILQAVTFAMSDTKKEAKESKDNIDKLRDSIDNLSNSFKEAIEKQREYSEKMEESTIKASISELESIKKAGGRWITIRSKEEGTQKYLIKWDSGDEAELQKLYSQLKDIQQPLSDYVNKSEQIAAAAEKGIGALRKLNVSYKDLKDSIVGLTKERDKYDAESKEFKHYDKIIKVIKQYRDEIEKTTKAHKEHLDMVAEGYKFVSDEEEKLFKKRIDMYDKLREAAIRAGVPLGKAEEFAEGAVLSLQPKSELEGIKEKYKLMQPVKLPEPPTETKEYKEMLEEVNGQLKEAVRWANTLGREIVRAFRDGRFEMKKFFEELLEMAAEISISKILASIFGFFIGGPPGAGAAAAMAGGIASPSNAVSNFVPKITSEQPVIVFENVIDGQQIIYKGIKKKQAVLR